MMSHEEKSAFCESVSSEIHEFLDGMLVEKNTDAGPVAIRVIAIVRQRDGTFSSVQLDGGKSGYLEGLDEAQKLSDEEGVRERYHTNRRGGERIIDDRRGGA